MPKVKSKLPDYSNLPLDVTANPYLRFPASLHKTRNVLDPVGKFPYVDGYSFPMQAAPVEEKIPEQGRPAAIEYLKNNTDMSQSHTNPTQTDNAAAVDTKQDVINKSQYGALTPEALATYLNPYADPKFKTALDTYSKKQEPEINFAPMAALADKWSGGGNQLLAAAQSMLDKDVAKSALLRQEAIDKRQQSSQNFTLSNNLSRDLQAAAKPYYQIKQAFPQIKEAVKPFIGPDGKPVVSFTRVNMILGQLIKMGGASGAQTEEDVKRAWAPFLAKDWAGIKYRFGGEDYIPAKYAGQLQDFIKIAEKSWDDTTQSRTQGVSSMYKLMGMSPELADSMTKSITYNLISSPNKEKAEEIKSLKGPAKGKSQKTFEEELDAELGL